MGTVSCSMIATVRLPFESLVGILEGSYLAFWQLCFMHRRVPVGVAYARNNVVYARNKVTKVKWFPPVATASGRCDHRAILTMTVPVQSRTYRYSFRVVSLSNYKPVTRVPSYQKWQYSKWTSGIFSTTLITIHISIFTSTIK